MNSLSISNSVSPVSLHCPPQRQIHFPDVQPVFEKQNLDPDWWWNTYFIVGKELLQNSDYFIYNCTLLTDIEHFRYSRTYITSTCEIRNYWSVTKRQYSRNWFAIVTFHTKQLADYPRPVYLVYLHSHTTFTSITNRCIRVQFSVIAVEYCPITCHPNWTVTLIFQSTETLFLCENKWGNYVEREKLTK
jgi:hypothetical protein